MNHSQTLKKRRGNNLTHSLRPILEANISLITKSDKKITWEENYSTK